MAEILENMAVKLFGNIDCYHSQHSEVADYVLPKTILSPTVAMLTRGFASIHLVKYSTATTAYL
jgi:hypothetical protein